MPAGETAAQAATFATNLAGQWKLNDAVLFVLSVEPSAAEPGVVRAGLRRDNHRHRGLGAPGRRIEQILPSLRACDPDTAILGGEGQLVAQLIGSSLGNVAPFPSFPPIPASPTHTHSPTRHAKGNPEKKQSHHQQQQQRKGQLGTLPLRAH